MSPELFVEWIRGLPVVWRTLAIVAVAVGAHGLVRGLRVLGEWVLTPAESPWVARRLMSRRKPKVATMTGLGVSALTFVIYFIAVGFLLRELTPITLGQYLASATVIGLAVGFGTQGLVQDIVTGLTLIFSDALDVGTLVEVSGQTGRVERIGLRFTTLQNFMGQTVFVPNRSIATIGRYRAGYARAFLDLEMPEDVDEARVLAAVRDLATSFRQQHQAVVLDEPRIHAVQRAGVHGWRFLRIRFRIWPGQQSLIEGPLRQRVTANIRELDPSFPDWKVTVTYRVQPLPDTATARMRAG